MIPGLPPLSFSSGPDISGPAYGGSVGLQLGDYSEGLNLTQMLLLGVGAIILFKLVK